MASEGSISREEVSPKMNSSPGSVSTMSLDTQTKTAGSEAQPHQASSNTYSAGLDSPAMAIAPQESPARLVSATQGFVPRVVPGENTGAAPLASHGGEREASSQFEAAEVTHNASSGVPIVYKSTSLLNGSPESIAVDDENIKMKIEFNSPSVTTDQTSVERVNEASGPSTDANNLNFGKEVPSPTASLASGSSLDFGPLKPSQRLWRNLSRDFLVSLSAKNDQTAEENNPTQISPLTPDEKFFFQHPPFDGNISPEFRMSAKSSQPREKIDDHQTSVAENEFEKSPSDSDDILGPRNSISSGANVDQVKCGETPEKQIFRSGHQPTSTPIRDRAKTSRETCIKEKEHEAFRNLIVKNWVSVRKGTSNIRYAKSLVIENPLEEPHEAGTPDSGKSNKDGSYSLPVGGNSSETPEFSPHFPEDDSKEFDFYQDLPSQEQSFSSEPQQNAPEKEPDNSGHSPRSDDEHRQSETNSSGALSSMSDCHVACELSYAFGVAIHEFLKDRLLAMMPQAAEKRNHKLRRYRNRYLSAMETLTHDFVVPHLQKTRWSSSVYDYFLFHLLDHIRTAVNERVWEGVDSGLAFDVNYTLKVGLEILEAAKSDFSRYCPTPADSDSTSHELTRSFDS